WSPWAKLDPNAKNSFEGGPQGKGAIFRWSGNYEVGEGSMTIVETRPNEFVKIQLDFTKPFSGTNTTEFLLKPQGDQTSVTWSMYGKRNFISKAMSIFMDCDQMIGGMYEKGFENLKKIVETKGL
ncbi:MAG: SRPBCC family protein, partial [Deltaproteobacteria bacterium]|nr:SRPBCC family protein [Deltaproteobacteria bacterium]